VPPALVMLMKTAPSATTLWNPFPAEGCGSGYPGVK
jgi:hypothetical protein